MPDIRIQRHLASETLPELKPLIGRMVEIIVREVTVPAPNPPEPQSTDERWSEVRAAIDQLQDYDFDAWREQREYDLRHYSDGAP